MRSYKPYHRKQQQRLAPPDRGVVLINNMFLKMMFYLKSNYQNIIRGLKLLFYQITNNTIWFQNNYVSVGDNELSINT